MTAIMESFPDAPGADITESDPIFISFSATDCAVQALDSNPYA